MNIILLLLIAFNVFASDNCSENLKQLSNHLKSSLLDSYQLPVEYTSQYYARRIEPKLSKPQFLEVKNPKKLYRGMFLSVDELENILQIGLKLADVNWTAGTGKAISFSSDINEAATYIFQNANERKIGIGVVFEVKNDSRFKFLDNITLNSTKTIFSIDRNINADEINNIYIWGEYGLENFSDIKQKVLNNSLKPHTTWTNLFK